jgi:hypothetical protein
VYWSLKRLWLEKEGGHGKAKKMGRVVLVITCNEIEQIFMSQDDI